MQENSTARDEVDALAEMIGEDLTTELYLQILNAGEASEQRLRSLGYPRSALASALVVLEGRGLIHHDGAVWRVGPPERALSALASQFESRAAHIRAAIPGLVAAYRNAQDRGGQSSGIGAAERLNGTLEVAEALARCFTTAHHTARAMRTHSMATRAATLAAIPGLRDGATPESLSRVRIETIIDATLLEAFTPDDFANFQELPNVDVRIANDVPFTAAVNDQGVAVVETYLDGRVDGLVVHDPGLVAAIDASIQLVQTLSTPWRARPHGSSDVSEEEQTILSMLAAGIPDTTIARRLGVSTRTLDRRTRALMDRLHVTTRFQLGSAATRRGWL